ncbi:tRNA uridine-5-carboxymethylaminomethyl(34) synthesis GTPase MnmE [Anoxybacter fermentans]|uniref:tRNA uridine-5-carboxymethylaminomethyl(34) synthesis GTPase MnmE n=1 Tax=Anoxybacter fermentans TaxID=1323375 RepID=UPI003AB759A8
MHDTIAAISTPIGEAGLGIIRVSGDQAVDIVDRIFRGKKRLKDTDTYQARYGYIIDFKSGKKIDEVICLLMRSPHSFTTEDVVEVGCHGGIVPLRRILNSILDAGARLAEPGEFTKRAFLNGRIDLAQAEAIIQIITSRTEKGMEIAVQQLEGGLSRKISNLRQKLIRVLAHLEAALDFPEDEIEGFSEGEIGKIISEVISEVEKLLKTSQTGKIYREGVRTIIVGRPNVGKSSLLNALLREQRAIVTDIPGTTRDVIEEMINLQGVPLKLIDTAGIRDTEDLVERLGVERSKELLNKADLVLLVLDVSQELTDEDFKIIEMIRNKKTIVVVNKTDLDAKIDQFQLQKIFPDQKIVRTSMVEEEGLDELRDAILELVFQGEVVSTDETIVTNLRHQRALEDALQSLNKAKESFKANMPHDFVTIDLKAGVEHLGKITGETLTEDIIDQIFAEFCLGK